MLKTRVLISMAVLASASVLAQSADDQGELLYNGIRLPKVWPPKPAIVNRDVRPVPYLQNPPAVIPIDVGRQLFVDDFLIEKTDLKREFHAAQRYENNPILKPETESEKKGPVATVMNDGVWFDPQDQLFKMWYEAGWFEGTAYATSKDGLTWERPVLDVVPGSNRVLPVEGHGHRDGDTIWLDLFAANPAERYKMYIYERPADKFGGRFFTSADGIHWDDKGRVHMGEGDNTTFFYNPFRKKWVYSIRTYRHGRARDYWEGDNIAQGIQTVESDHSQWAGTDELDKPDPGMLAFIPPADVIAKEATASNKSVETVTKSYHELYGDPPQLYNLDAVGYESIMLGVFAILEGPTGSKGWTAHKGAKVNDLEFAFSRDGFNWDRSDRTPFLASARKEGAWDRGYLHPAGGICAVVGDKLYIFYGGWSGVGPKGLDVYAGGAMGVAFLRRDGFASMEAGQDAGQLTTRTLTFKGNHMFVNVVDAQGELKAEALDEQGKVIAPFSLENCRPVTVDSTRQPINWQGASDLSALSGRKVKFHFQLRRGALYSFWVTPDAKGASFGYVAASGPGLNGPIDDGGTAK